MRFFFERAGDWSFDACWRDDDDAAWLVLGSILVGIERGDERFSWSTPGRWVLALNRPDHRFDDLTNIVEEELQTVDSGRRDEARPRRAIQRKMLWRTQPRDIRAVGESE